MWEESFSKLMESYSLSVSLKQKQKKKIALFRAIKMVRTIEAVVQCQFA